VRAHVCALLSRAASPAVATPGNAAELAGVLCSLSGASATPPSRGLGPKATLFFAKRSLWATHISPWDVLSSCHQPSSSAKLCRAAAPLRPGVERLVCHPKPKGVLMHTPGHMLLRPQSIHWIWCGRPIPSSPHDRPHRATPRRISPDPMRPTAHILPTCSPTPPRAAEVPGGILCAAPHQQPRRLKLAYSHPRGCHVCASSRHAAI
jgi:hypothetical protein